MPFPFGRGHARAAVAAALIGAVPSLAAAEPVALDEVTVTGTREGELKSETPKSVSVLDGATIDMVKPTHPSELFNRIPGVSIQPTTGEGHTTAIRQPITTDPVYLFLEDGVPTRATGFFNHNALYEVNIPQAESVEVIRGPGSALHGSDAIGGVINVLTKAPSLEFEAGGTVEAGSDGWRRLLATASDGWAAGGARIDANLTHSDGWRDATEYDRRSATLRVDHVFDNGALLKTVLSGSDIDQQTGAASRLSLGDYRHHPKTNYTPVAFREVQALRLSTSYEQEWGDSLLTLTPYARWNEMDLLPAWQLTYDPVLYTTGHRSLGLLAKFRHDFAPWRTRLVAGIDLDYSPGFRKEWSLNRSFDASGRIVTSYAKNQKTYDYDVTYMQASPYLHAETSPVDALRLSAGLRLDLARYEYDDHLGALQIGSRRRPADTNLNYDHLSPSLGATYAFTSALNGFANYKHAFRAPSESDLFRQGRSVDTVGLAPVKVDSYEIGLRGPSAGPFTWEIAAYTMTKDDDILSSRDASGITTTTNSGKTRHRGVEVGLGWAVSDEIGLHTAWSYAKHTYEDWSAGGVTYDGNEIPLAPRWIGNVILRYAPRFLAGSSFEAEWAYLGDYYLDELNTADYDGHGLLHLRAAWRLNDNLSLFGRIYNVTDERWATTGMVRNGQEEYNPGMPRSVFAGLTVKF